MTVCTNVGLSFDPASGLYKSQISLLAPRRNHHQPFQPGSKVFTHTPSVPRKTARLTPRRSSTNTQTHKHTNTYVLSCPLMFLVIFPACNYTRSHHSDTDFEPSEKLRPVEGVTNPFFALPRAGEVITLSYDPRLPHSEPSQYRRRLRTVEGSSRPSSHRIDDPWNLADSECEREGGDRKRSQSDSNGPHFSSLHKRLDDEGASEVSCVGRSGKERRKHFRCTR